MKTSVPFLASQNSSSHPAKHFACVRMTLIILCTVWIVWAALAAVHPRNSRSAPQVCSAACHFLCTWFFCARIATAFSGSGALEQLMHSIRAALANHCRHVLDRECLVLPNTFVHNEFAVSSHLAILNERRGGLGDYRLNCALDVWCISLDVTQQSMSRCKAAAVVDWRCDVYFASATRRERLFCGNMKVTSH